MRPPVRRVRATLALLGLVLLAPALPGARAADALPPSDYVVIVHGSNPITTIDRRLVSDLFLKRRALWADGRPVVPVDQGERSQVRERFSEEVHGKSTMAIRAFWQQQIFSGKGTPPVQKPSDRAVADLVAATPGAIGYVAAGAVPAGVRVVPIQFRASQP
jgi:ABC-type phosphate transport system substrate-binding protein